MFDLATIVAASRAAVGPTSSATGGGGDTVILWIGCGLMLFGVVCFTYLRLRKATAASRGFYDKSIMIVAVATCAYMAMALGIASIHPQGIAPGSPDSMANRIYLPRYADWAITTPLLLLDLILFAKPLLNKGWQWDAMIVVGLDVLMIVTGVVAGLITAPDRWYFFWASNLCFAGVTAYVFTLFAKARRIQEPQVSSRLRLLTGYLLVLWFVYPIIWALYFGGVMGGTIEDLAYMVLDVLAKVVFGFILLMGPAVELVDKTPSVAPPDEESERGTSRVGRVGIAR